MLNNWLFIIMVPFYLTLKKMSPFQMPLIFYYDLLNVVLKLYNSLILSRSNLTLCQLLNMGKIIGSYFKKIDQ